MLASVFAAAVLALCVYEFFNSRRSQTITPERAVQLMNHQEALVLDTRADNAFAEGHISGAQNVSVSSLERKFGALEKHLARPVIIVGGADEGASKLSAALQQKGFLQVFILNGGIPGWRAAGLPLVKS